MNTAAATTAPDRDTTVIRVRTYTGRSIRLTPGAFNISGISVRDIAAHLGKIVYFPESAHAPFTAAQYALELASAVRKHGPACQLYALLMNAHEAYLGHVPPAVRQAERLLTSPTVFNDGRATLVHVFRTRILGALILTGSEPADKQIEEETPSHLQTIHPQQRRLNATLERDLGARSFCDGDSRRDEPLPQIIAPMRWDKAIERYMQTYEELATLTGRKVAR